jgi:hypothetical protein
MQVGAADFDCLVQMGSWRLGNRELTHDLPESAAQVANAYRGSNAEAGAQFTLSKWHWNWAASAEHSIVVSKTNGDQVRERSFCC